MDKMKKAILIIASFAILLIFGSAYTERNRAPKEGYMSPVLMLERDGETVSIDRLRGEYVLLTFWSSGDARSRLMCNRYETYVDSDVCVGKGICMVAVNFDRSENLFREVVYRDCMNADAQFHVEGSRALKIIEDFALDNGFKSFLLDRSGRIVATDPDTDYLTKILNS